MVVFDCPVGAPADAKELEYVSGLHQTAPLARSDGSIAAVDIMLFLKSRFGLDVTVETVTGTILQGMGGGEDEGEVIDLMEMTAILLIPYLVKTAALQEGQTLPEGSVVPSKHSLRVVLQMILHDIGMEQSGEDADDNADAEKNSPALTAALIQRILRAYGEEDLANNETLIQAMLAQVEDHTVLDEHAFAQALTHDVQLYKLDHELQYNTIYQALFAALDQEQRKDEKKRSASRKQSGKNKENESSRAETMDVTQQAGSGHVPENESSFESPKVTHTFTAPAIDSTAGTYRSKTLLICVWAGTLFSYFSAPIPTSSGDSACDPYTIGEAWQENMETMSCETITSVLEWLFLFISLMIFGVLWVGCGSCGNHHKSRFWKPVLAAAFVVFAAISTVTDPNVGEGANNRYVVVVAVTLAFVVTILHLLHLVFLCARDDSNWKKRLQKSAFQKEVDLKLAIQFKVNRMVNNALDIHRAKDDQKIIQTYYGRALHTFSKWNKTETVGGLQWAWSMIFSKTLFRQEGVWYSARLIAANLSQYIVVLYTLLAGVYYARIVSENFDSEEAKEKLSAEAAYFISNQVQPEDVERYTAEIASFVGVFLNDLALSNLISPNCSEFAGSGTQVLDQVCQGFLGCDNSNSTVRYDTFCTLFNNEPNLAARDQLTLLDGAGLDSELVLEQVHAAVQQGIDDSVDSLYPNEKYMVVVPFSIGIAFAVLTCLFLAVSYLPSITSTTMQLRTGVIPTLSDPKSLNRYRAAPDTVTLLTGSLFWGCLFSGAIVGSLVGLVVFLFVWQGSVYFVQRAVAIMIGIVVVALVRIGALCYGRRRYFRSFYRRKPAAANIYFLAMEWSNFALTAGFVFVRLVKLLFVAGLSVGRIDTRFLAKGVGEIGAFELDPFPTIHMRDIMSHEAHRHPYIEMLGTIYMFKLKHGPAFCSSAGSCWRLIFVYALMPWMQKYRIFDAAADDDDDAEGAGEMDGGKNEPSPRHGSTVVGGMRGSLVAAPHLWTDQDEMAKDVMIRRLKQENIALKEHLAELTAKLGESGV